LTRLLLADDHPMFRAGLRALLERRPGHSVVVEASTGREAVALAREHEPEIAIVDVGMPDLNGILATREIRASLPSVRVIALSTHADRRYVVEMLAAGASAYVLKISAYDELLAAIAAVSRGDRYLSPAVTGAVVDAALAASAATEPGSALGRREREIVQLIAEGLTSAQIAKRLHISARTVDAHRRNILQKLGVRSVPELTKWAIREGLTQLED
jgi:DNA-binding NarL/FixJ family response regulator